jgi:hypothetical protein
VAASPALEPSPRSDVRLGVTYSPRYARHFGLEPRLLYSQMLDELGVRHVRLPLYWDEVEPEPDAHDFSELDSYLAEAEARGVELVLSLGYKQPRWPEWYAPAWTAELPVERMRERILRLVAAEVAHARHSPSIAMWQVENEPYRNFGDGGDRRVLSADFLAQEIDLVRRQDHRPTLMSDSGELSSAIQVLSLPADRFGTTLYRQRWFPGIGFWQHPLPAWFYLAKDRLARALLRKGGETIIVELQAEAWFEDSAGLPYVHPDTQNREFPADLLLGANVEYARRTHAPEVYLWGVEWWYWMREQGHPEYVDAARRAFRAAGSELSP